MAFLYFLLVVMRLGRGHQGHDAHGYNRDRRHSLSREERRRD